MPLLSAILCRHIASEQNPRAIVIHGDDDIERASGRVERSNTVKNGFLGGKCRSQQRERRDDDQNRTMSKRRIRYIPFPFSENVLINIYS